MAPANSIFCDSLFCYSPVSTGYPLSPLLIRCRFQLSVFQPTFWKMYLEQVLNHLFWGLSPPAVWSVNHAEFASRWGCQDTFESCRFDSSTPSTHTQKECHDSPLHRLHRLIYFSMLLQVIFRSRTICHMKSSVGLPFQKCKFWIPPWNLTPLILCQGQAFSKEAIIALFRLVSSLSMSPGVVTLPIHIPVDWFNSWSYTDQLVRRGLWLTLGSFVSCFSMKVIYLWSDIESSPDTCQFTMSYTIGGVANVTSITD